MPSFTSGVEMVPEPLWVAGSLALMAAVPLEIAAVLDIYCRHAVVDDVSQRLLCH